MFYLDIASLDYLTVTTYSPLAYTAMDNWAKSSAKHHKEARALQYAGRNYFSAAGTVFCGSGEQKGAVHNMVRASGLASDGLWHVAQRFIRGGTARATRLDLQITTEYDRPSWSQPELHEYCRTHGNRSCSYVESKSGPAGSTLATVYYGSRSSDRFVRIYEKMGLGEDVYLRFEVEYKGDRARVAANMLLEKTDAASILRSEVESVPHPATTALFSSALGNGPANGVVAIRPESKTVKWLIETVAPSLDRVLNDHNINSDGVRDLFQKILDDGRS